MRDRRRFADTGGCGARGGLHRTGHRTLAGTQQPVEKNLKTRMRWRKLGNIYQPAHRHPKLLTHAANPLAVRLSGDVYRIYYSARDRDNRSSVGCVDMDIRARQVVAVR